MASTPPPPLGEDPPFAPTLAAARTGTTWALKQLYHHHAPQVAGYLGRRGVPDVEASTKAVFLRMARNLASFEGGEDDFRAMLFSFTRGQAMDDLGEAPTRPLADSHPGERRRQKTAITPIRPGPRSSSPLSSPLSLPAVARLRSLAGAHPGWIFVVAAFALVAVVVATGAPALLPSASRPKLGAVDVSPASPGTGPAPPAKAQPAPTDDPIPPCPSATPGSSTPGSSTPGSSTPGSSTSTTSPSTPVSPGSSTCAPTTAAATTDGAVPKTATTVEPKAATTTSTTVQRSTTTTAPSPAATTSTSAPRRRSSY